MRKTQTTTAPWSDPATRFSPLAISFAVALFATSASGASGASSAPPSASPTQAAHPTPPETNPDQVRTDVHTAGNPLAKERFAEARKLLGEGSPDKAIEAVQEGLKLEPRSTDGLNLLGIIYDQQKDYAQSLAAFRRALEIDPRSTETHNNLGLSYFTQKKLDLAEQEFESSLRLDRRDRTANYNLGLMRLAAGKPKEAIAYLSRVNPPDASTSINLVQAYLGAHETAEALKLASSVSARAPSDVRVHFSLGVMLAAAKQYAPASHEFELADALNPGTPEILHDLGQVYLEDHKAVEAQRVLERAAKLAPDSAETLYLLGRAYSDQRNTIQALEVLLKARKLAPRNTDVIFLMARLSMMQSFYEDAIQLLEEGVKIAPRRPDLRAALGESYFTAGRIDKAKEQFQTLIELDPSASSYVFMGLSYRHQGRFEEAKKYFNLGLEKDPKNFACLYNLGYIANKQGDQAGAEKLLKAALASNPDYDDALYELAAVKVAQQKFAEAVPLLRRSASLSAHPGEAYYKLATAERRLHQNDAAERDMKIFETLAKDPTSGPYPLQHLFEYLDQRTALPSKSRAQIDLAELTQEVKAHPENPRSLYLLAEAHLKLGQTDQALETAQQLDQLSGGDARTMLGVGVLLARYRLYPQAIRRFQAALAADPLSDDARYNLAVAYYQTRDYPHALEVLGQASGQAQKDDAVLSLLGDVDAHLGRTAEAIRIFQQAAAANPDNDRHYLSLALAQLQAGDRSAGLATLRRGRERIPDSGRILWGLGVLSALAGDNAQAESSFQRAIDLMPEWQSGYSALGTFYFETGQIEKARQTLDRYQKLFPQGLLNVTTIQQTLAQASSQPSAPQALSPQGRQQFLSIALVLADETP